MDVYKTHGAFSWSELMTTDPAGRDRVLRPAVRLDRRSQCPWAMGDYHVAKVGDTGGRRHHGQAARSPGHAAALGHAMSR
jgi:hypothetical protein